MPTLTTSSHGRTLTVNTGSFWPTPTEDSIRLLQEIGWPDVELTLQAQEFYLDFERQLCMPLLANLVEMVESDTLRVHSVHAPNMLAEHGQFLPFDPPFEKDGATLGGTTAANLSGPLRYHFGGVRDFILGVNFLDSQGQLIHSGGKVVKNAAGFDIPKLMVGSLGSFGAMIELSFKVFPKPQEYMTLIASYQNLAQALEKLVELTTSSAEVLALDIEPVGKMYNLMVRLGGDPKLFGGRKSKLDRILEEVEVHEGEKEARIWQEVKDFGWVPNDAILVKVPIIPKHLPQLDEILSASSIRRRYSAGANVAWIAWSGTSRLLDQNLQKLNLSGLSILGNSEQTRFGKWDRNSFYAKIKSALDPTGLWVEV